MSSDIALIDPSLIDSNRWYALFIAGQGRRNQTLGCIYGQGTKSGAITIDPEAPSLPKQRWQIYPLNSTTYVLRNQRGGANAFLGAFFEPKETAEGQTRPRIVRGDIADATVYWSFGRWGDGTYWMSNAANGTDWHYDVSDAKGNAMKMSRDIAPPQANQRWNFEAVAVIDDSIYSTVDLLGATVTTPNTASASLPSNTPTSNPSTSSTSSTNSADPSNSLSSSRLSTGATAGIGAGIGGAVLIALVVLGLFLFRRRKQRPAAARNKAVEPYEPPAMTTAQAPQPYQDPRAFGKHEMYHDSSAAKYEMPAPPMAEIEGHESPAELPSSPLAGRR